MSVLLMTTGVQPLPAQNSPVPGRLTVQPLTMATGTENPEVGVHRLDSFPIIEHPWVYVPPRCAGSQRCPLVFFLHNAPSAIRRLGPMADKYGMIVLAPKLLFSPSDQPPIRPLEFPDAVPVIRAFDLVLQQVLRQFAIDPGKIAIMGTCQTAEATLRIGGDNLDVFSRVVVISPTYPALLSTANVDPPHRTAEFLFEAGDLESRGTFRGAQELRRKGHRVTHAISFRGHEHQWESVDYVGHWLHTTWTTPNPAARPAPAVVADPLPVLTTDIVARMTAFWTRLQQAPDSIRTDARRAHLREVVVPVGNERPVFWMTDVVALAAQYPSVDAALTAAGLTAPQHEAYRAALASARVTWNVGYRAGPVAPGSVLDKNMGFMNAHPDAFKALDATGIWRTP